MMRAFSIAALAVAALPLAGCGDSNNSANVNLQAPLPQVPAPNNGDWTQMVSATPEGGFVMGNPNARVKLVEFASMTCPHCRAFSQEGGQRLRDVYVKSGQVSYEFRNYVLNPLDTAASLVTRCAGPAGFFRLTEQLYTNQDRWAQNVSSDEERQLAQLPEDQRVGALIRAAELDAFFRQRGIPEAQLNQCLANRAELQRLATMREQASRQFQVPGTPAFVINGRLYGDIASWDELEPALRQHIGG